VAVHPLAESIACLKIGLDGRADVAAGDLGGDWRFLHARDRLADVEPEAGVERERAAVVGGRK
jgi:hypothetical protein